jgi:four helix bundle protein
MIAQSDVLFARLKDFAGRMVKLTTALPKTYAGRQIGGQLLRSGTSVGAHYGEARRAKSDADFISKIEGGLQELDESSYWLSLIERCNMIPPHRLQSIREENEQLIRIFVTIAKNARASRRSRSTAR